MPLSPKAKRAPIFERLRLAFFLNDPVQAEGYEAVWTWSEWAKAIGRDGKDVGIDLVAKLRNEGGFAAIQAKFYAADTRIQKTNIDSFISASGKEPFRRRVVLDTIEKEWGTNAEEMIRDQAIPVVRIGLPAWADTEWLKQLVAEQMVILCDDRRCGRHRNLRRDGASRAWIGQSSGQTSYEGIAAQLAAAASDPAVRGIALEIDSFGGDVAGVFRDEGPDRL